MAQQANTFETYDAVGNREELADRIWNISPDETPFLSMIGRQAVKSTHPEWQTDTYATPTTSNNVPEGNDWSYDAVTPTVRVGNYTQISEKTLIVSRTQDNTDKAGRRSELAYQLAKKGVELKQDMEVTLLSNQASSAGTGNGATNRTLGALRAWLSTNDSLGGGGGASGGFNSGTGIVDAATNGSQRAFTKTIMDEVILAAYTAGGSPDTWMVSPYVKTVFSTLLDAADIVTSRREVRGTSQAVLVAAADTYVSDFGVFTILPNRQMARVGAAVARNAFCLDMSTLKLGVFDDVQVHKPAKTGDAEKRVLNVEYTLIVRNEAANGVAADLYGMASGA